MNIIIRKEDLENIKKKSILDDKIILKNEEQTGLLDVIYKINDDSFFSSINLNQSFTLSFEDFFISSSESSFFNSSEKFIYLSSLRKESETFSFFKKDNTIEYADILNYNFLHEYGHALFDSIKFDEKSFISGNIKEENKSLANIINSITPLPLGFHNLFYEIFYNSIEEGFADIFSMIVIDKIYSKEKSENIKNAIYNSRKEDELYIPDYINDVSQKKIAYFNSASIKEYMDNCQNNKLPDFESYQEIRDYIFNSCIENLKKTLEISVPALETNDIGKNILYKGLGIMYRLNNQLENNNLKYNYYFPKNLLEFNKNMKNDFSCILGKNFEMDEKFKDSWDNGYCKADDVFYAIQNKRKFFSKIKPLNSEFKIKIFEKNIQNNFKHKI